MVVIPIHDMVILPDVTFYFKKDFFRSLHIESVTEGEDVLFLMMRGDKERSSLSEEDVFPYGVSGHIGPPAGSRCFVKGVYTFLTGN